jgi:hypothetical protein
MSHATGSEYALRVKLFLQGALNAQQSFGHGRKSAGQWIAAVLRPSQLRVCVGRRM